MRSSPCWRRIHCSSAGSPAASAHAPAGRDAPARTAIGVAGVTFYGALWAAAANDQIAYHLQIPLYTVTWFFRIAALAGPPLAYIITQWICLGLTRRERDEAQHGLPTGRIVMTRAAIQRDHRASAASLVSFVFFASA